MTELDLTSFNSVCFFLIVIIQIYFAWKIYCVTREPKKRKAIEKSLEEIKNENKELRASIKKLEDSLLKENMKEDYELDACSMQIYV